MFAYRTFLLSKAFVVITLCGAVEASPAPQQFNVDFYRQICSDHILETDGETFYPRCDRKDLDQKTVFEAAEQAALDSGKKLLVLIGTDWCEHCQAAHRFYSRPDVERVTSQRFVVVLINADAKSSAALLRRLTGRKPAAVPAAVVYNPKVKKSVAPAFDPKKDADVMAYFGLNRQNLIQLIREQQAAQGIKSGAKNSLTPAALLNALRAEVKTQAMFRKDPVFNPLLPVSEDATPQARVASIKKFLSRF